MKGKLIVIEGIDGSGKATQTKLLVAKLEQQGQQIATFDFPRHQQKFFGVLVDDYLNNKFGDAAKLDPHVSSLFFACDRWEAKDILNQWLAQGKTVILDRYTTSNMGHQSSKIAHRQKRDIFLNWLDELEFEVFKIPKPDIVFYLDVDAKIVRKLMDNRSDQGKEYIEGKQDGHESNQTHLEQAAQAYRYLCDKYNYWHKIECTKKDVLLTPLEIHDKIWKKIQ